MPTNYTPLTNGQFATASVFNAPLEELDAAIENLADGDKVFTILRISATAPEVFITGTTSNYRSLRYQTGGVNRWNVACNPTPESGSDAGSNYEIRAFNDAGTYLFSPMIITRSSGDVAFAGTVSKGGGSFDIDHPLDPENRDLIHSFIEGPRADLIYRGRVQLEDGQAVVDIDLASHMTPGTFAALTKHAQAQVFIQNEGPGWSAVRGQLSGGTLTIEAQNNGSQDRVSWLVIAERNDAFYLACGLTDAQGQFITERDKVAPTPEELAQLEASDDGIGALIGKRGYPKHAHLTGHARPMRITERGG